MSQDSKLFIDPSYAFQDRTSVYLFSNENVTDSIKCMGNMQDANVLTVGSSGDHAFESYLAGAKNVDTFDINSFQQYVVELKLHMLRHLDLNAFRDFFFDNKYFFSHKIIQPFEHKFSDGLRDFMEMYRKNGRTMFKNLGKNNPMVVSYLDNEYQYKKLGETVPEQINFKHCRLDQVPTIFSQKYDVIMLSNIFEYLYRAEKFMELRMQRFYGEILNPIAKNNLSQNGGRIILHYMWNAPHSGWKNFMDYFQKRYNVAPEHTMDARAVFSATPDLGADFDTLLILRQNQILR